MALDVTIQAVWSMHLLCELEKEMELNHNPTKFGLARLSAPLIEIFARRNVNKILNVKVLRLMDQIPLILTLVSWIMAQLSEEFPFQILLELHLHLNIVQVLAKASDNLMLKYISF